MLVASPFRIRFVLMFVLVVYMQLVLAGSFPNARYVTRKDCEAATRALFKEKGWDNDAEAKEPANQLRAAKVVTTSL